MNSHEAAARWWRQSIQNPGREGTAGDEMIDSFTDQCRDLIEDLDAEVTKEFEENIIEVLGEAEWDYDRCKRLTTDYEPKGLLLEAVKRTDVLKDRKALTILFPHKVWMRVRPDCVKLRNGYGADEEIIFTERDGYIGEADDE